MLWLCCKGLNEIRPPLQLRPKALKQSPSLPEKHNGLHNCHPALLLQIMVIGLQRTRSKKKTRGPAIRTEPDSPLCIAPSTRAPSKQYASALPGHSGPHYVETRGGLYPHICGW